MRPRILRPHMHRAEIIHPPGGRGQPVQVAEYFAEHRAGFTAARLRGLAEQTADLRGLADCAETRSHGDLRHFTESLVRLLESPLVSTCADPLPTWLADAGIAVDYLLHANDLIPDALPEIGYVDDARVVALAFRRHRELDRFL